MTYLGSGIWSYTCEKRRVESLLYNVWLRANLFFLWGDLEIQWKADYNPPRRQTAIQFSKQQLESTSMTSFSLTCPNLNPTKDKNTVCLTFNVIKLQMPTPPSPPHLPQSWSHLIGQCSSHNHDIRLSRTCSEHHTEAVHVVTRRRHVHHLHSTTGQAEGHGPQRALKGTHSRNY